jgi:hypothetical protein
MRFLPPLVAAVVGGAVAAAIALAAIPDSSGTINGCYDTAVDPHPLSVVDAPADCKKTLLQFNQTGPQGPAGTVGGVQLAFAEIVQLDKATDEYGATVNCPAGAHPAERGLRPRHARRELRRRRQQARRRRRRTPRVGSRFSLKPAFIRERAVSDTLLGALNGLFNRSLGSEEEGTRALHSIFSGLLPGGAGGNTLSAKERNRIATGLKGLKADDGRLHSSVSKTRRAIGDLLTFAPPTTIPEAAVFALCSSG